MKLIRLWHLAIRPLETKIASFLAMDLAGPMFHGTKPEEVDQGEEEEKAKKVEKEKLSEILDRSDADRVIVVHTCMQWLGNDSKAVDAHLTFYVGGGNLPSVNPIDAHSAAYSVYAAGFIRDPERFPAYHCETIEQAVTHKCASESEIFMSGEKPKDFDTRKYESVHFYRFYLFLHDHKIDF